MISVQEALCRITNIATSFGTETIALDEALGRILATDIVSRTNSTANQQDYNYAPHSLQVRHKQRLPSRQFEKALVSNVFMPDMATKYRKKPLPFHKVSGKGDLRVRKALPVDTSAISVLAAIGHYTVQVEKLPEVAIVSTGSEIVPVGKPLLPHQIRDSNSYHIKAFLRKFGILSPVSTLVQDNKQVLKESIRKLLAKDIIIVSGGVSKGEADYIPEVLTSLGVEKVFHGVKMKPGAPFWFGKSPGGGVIFGLPGNPLSVQVACRIFLEPYLCACFGIPPRAPVMLPFATERIKKSKFEEFFPCRIISHSSFSSLLSVKHNGSGDISSTITSDGIALHPEMIPSLAENAPVNFYFW